MIRPDHDVIPWLEPEVGWGSDRSEASDPQWSTGRRADRELYARAVGRARPNSPAPVGLDAPLAGHVAGEGVDGDGDREQ